MPSQLVEFIPNFSEARRPEVVQAIVQAIEAVPGIHVLDLHSDLDHNRTVITFVGAPSAAEEAAFQAIETAGQLIDLDRHTGEHPRIGATDVVPFVPIRDVTMQECVEIARRLGQRVGAGLGIPVYLYEEAATRTDRQNLENIRRGQYEALKEEISTNPERRPDFGPARVGPAGATVIGARQPLIAYNVYLTTDDVQIAQKIAKAIRNSSGGFRFVKALGLLVEGRAQVSMNLTNFHQSPLAQVVEMIRREAQRYGAGIHHSELVGLIPQEALVNAAQWYLQLDDFKPDQVLETKLSAALSTRLGEALPTQESRFLDELAAGTATPGGGSAAAHAGATAAALVAMVARLTIGKKKYADVETRMWEILDQADALRGQLSAAVEQDASAFESVIAALRRPKQTEAEQSARLQALEAATLTAAEVPAQVAGEAAQVLALAVEQAETANLNAISDAASAAALARASLTCAALNVRMNVKTLQDRAPAAPLLEAISGYETEAAELEGRLQAALVGRGGLPA